MTQLGTCDIKQYEHIGPHERFFACVNWKPAPSVPSEGVSISGTATVDHHSISHSDEIAELKAQLKAASSMVGKLARVLRMLYDETPRSQYSWAAGIFHEAESLLSDPIVKEAMKEEK